MGVVPVRSGRVLFDGDDIAHETPYERVRRGIGYVPQGREIFSRLTVGENLEMGLAYRPGLDEAAAGAVRALPGAEADARTGAAATFPAASSSSSRSPARSPPGRACCVLDEPTEGIQPSIIKDIGRVIRMLADTGLPIDGQPRRMAIVLVEQYYDFAEELADRYCVMERGEIVQQGRGADMAAEGARARMSI